MCPAIQREFRPQTRCCNNVKLGVNVSEMRYESIVVWAEGAMRWKSRAKLPRSNQETQMN